MREVAPPLTHTELVVAAHRWLRGSQRHPVVLCEPVRLCVSESPDVIGWASSGLCTVVECKTSRADFWADLRKPHRREADRGLGEMRWYFAEPGVLRVEDLPDGWGLAEVRALYTGGRRVTRVRPPTRQELHNVRGAASMLVQSVERLTDGWRSPVPLKVFGGWEPDTIADVYATETAPQEGTEEDMSAKGRTRKEGPAYDSPAHDDFPTPPWAIERLLERLATELHAVGPKWIEPCSGAGSIIRTVDKFYTDNSPEGHAWRPDWSAVELQHRYRQALRGLNVAGYLADFPTWAASRPAQSYDVAISNPPYGIAETILASCQRIAKVTILLLRTPFIASEKRADLMRAWTPDLFGLPNRPNFVAGGSDNADYAWMRWTHGTQGQPGRVVVLGSTPVEVRTGEAA